MTVDKPAARRCCTCIPDQQWECCTRLNSAQLAVPKVRVPRLQRVLVEPFDIRYRHDAIMNSKEASVSSTWPLQALQVYMLYGGFPLCHRPSGFHQGLNMIAIGGTSDRPCWLAEACKSLLLFTEAELASELLYKLSHTQAICSCREDTQH